MFDLLKEKNYKLGAIESFTGGAFSKEITSIPGASKVFVGSVVSYATELKQQLGVDVSNGVISKECAISMAVKASEFLKSDVTIAFTGNAGPSAMEDKPVGLCYIAIKIKDIVECYEFNFKGNRNEVVNQGVEKGLEKIKQLIS